MSSSEQSSKFTDPSQKDRSSAVSPQAPDMKKTGGSKGHTASEILLHRPRRPAPPEPQPEPETPVEATASIPENSTTDLGAQQPIPSPSEPMQYRAIGLVRGAYKPSDEQFNRGTLVTEDGTHLDAVLLGQVMSLVKKYLDLEQPYLWVVYPRTRDKQETLHVQIVGVWSDEGFGAEEESADEPSETNTANSAGLAAPLQDGYFSVRGQVVFHSPEKQFVLVKIQQAPRKSSDRPKDFKLKLLGTLEGQPIGYFWDLQVQRQGNALAITTGTSVAMVPLKKRKKSGSPHPKKKSDAPRAGHSKPITAPKRGQRTIEPPIKRQARSSGNE
ncbi:MAG: hypothetical protein AAF329_00150 [Cyanobacteria bacterium P01_A01_bin.17]